ncbi:hypothetical protein [Roseomonas sp. BN140053]|uniref:hypothetical protein n=1 Tax=Roseomonas sp. BN140053 TaxID=3391898 RepID=UPI0039EA9C27
MRATHHLLPLLLLLGGCEAAIGPFLGVNAVLLPLTGRTGPDIIVSAVTGRDCSLAYVDGGERHYCRPDPPPPAPVALCTRSIGSVDCWTALPPGLPPPRPMADTPPAPPSQPPARWPLNRL